MDIVDMIIDIMKFLLLVYIALELRDISAKLVISKSSVYPAETNGNCGNPVPYTDIPASPQEDNCFALLESQSNRGMITGIVARQALPWNR